MISVNINQLLSAIDETDAFELPGMSAGAEYIYDNIYLRLLRGEEVKLSQINWDSFELGDVDTMRDLYSKVLAPGEIKADSLADTLRGLPPAAAGAAFV